MITLLGGGTIRTSRNFKGHWALVASTGYSQAKVEARRLAREEELLARRRVQHCRRRETWRRHFAHVAGPCRVLPPAARERLSERCS